jgi:hypothetical protein
MSVGRQDYGHPDSLGRGKRIGLGQDGHGREFGIGSRTGA